MRVIRRLVLLAVIGGLSVAAYQYASDSRWPVRLRGAALETRAITQQATRLANRAGSSAGDAAGKLGDTMSESALTAKIKSKMALDDHVRARAVNVDTAGSVVTLTGTVATAVERKRAVDLARDTEGVSQVVDRLHVRTP